MTQEMDNEIRRWSQTEEGQFFERKSAVDQRPGLSKPRKAADIAMDVAVTLSAMANADGGELVIGIENNGDVTGVPHPEDKVRLLLGVPKDRNYVSPSFDAIGGAVLQVALRNEPIYDRATLDWLANFKNTDLSGDQKRILAYAHAHGDRFTSRNYQEVIKTDIYGASSAIKDMIRKGVVHSTEKGSRIYHIQEPLTTQPGMPSELVRLLPALQRRGHLSNGDVRRTLGLTRITAARLLKELVAVGWLTGTGKRGVGALYSPGLRLLHQSHIAPNDREADAMPPKTDAMES